MKGKTVSCNYCDAVLYRQPSQLKRSEKYYCNDHCHGLSLRGIKKNLHMIITEDNIEAYLTWKEFNGDIRATAKFTDFKPQFITDSIGKIFKIILRNLKD